MPHVTTDEMRQMAQPKQPGDLVQNMSGELGIVVEVGHAGCACTGDMKVRYLGKPYMGDGHHRASNWKLIARAAELALPRPAFTSSTPLVATDDWGRPRCQEIGVYADVDEFFQCAMTVGHDGDCDPLPIQPSADEAERLLADAYVTIPVADASGLAAQMQQPSSKN